MGLAASQGRFLSLTARNNDLVYEGQQISQQRIALADKTKEVAMRYTEAMNNKVMQATVLVNGSQMEVPLSYDLIVNPDTCTGLGMRLVDLDDNVVIPGDYIEVTKKEANKEAETKRVYSTEDFIKNYLPDVDEATAIDLMTKSMAQLKEYYDNLHKNDQNSPVVKVNPVVKEGERTLTDAKCLDNEYIQKMLTTGEWKIQKKNTESWDDYMWQGSNNVSEVYDTSDDAAAEAQYEADMLDIQKRDKILELRLEQIETEQNAVETEIDSVKKIIDKNIEGSFKTFA